MSRLLPVALAALIVCTCTAAAQEEGVNPTPPSANPESPASANEAADIGERGLSAASAARANPDSIPAPQDIAYPGTLTLNVDATDVERRIFNVHESIPVAPGAFTLLYPEWLPGNHAPRGPIDSLAGLVIRGGGQPLPWVRDAVNVYAFHVQVPANVSQLELEFQFVSSMAREQGRIVMTPELLGLQWNAVLLYPAGYDVGRIRVDASLGLPPGWDFAAALDIESRQAGQVHFKPASLAMLVDSPLFAGRYFKTLELDPGARIPVHLNIVADAPELLDIKPQQLAAHRKLVREAYALFGAPHYDRYEFLLALSEHFGEIGLEHMRSSENRRPPNYFLEWDRVAATRDLLPHEFTHAWNGKYRVPAGLLTANFNVPTHNSLLWVYEGLTTYLSTVLAARSGLWSEEFTRQAWASMVANMELNRPGRSWRDLEDTTEQPIITARRPLSWLSWQRTEDYYTDGALIWLEVDARLRELSGGRRSLDDFIHRFIEDGPHTSPATYIFSDIVRALRATAPFDWEKLLEERVHGHNANAPSEGLMQGGWQLVYTEAESEYLRSFEDQRKVLDFTYSLGFDLSLLSNQLTEVRWGGPAFAAGLTAGTTLIAVNGREYRPDRLRLAISMAKLNKQPIELLVKNLDRYRTVRLAYFDGLRYPHLQRNLKAEDRLTPTLKPRT